MTKQDPSSRVLFVVPDGEGGTDVESVWATDLGRDRYELANCPLFAYAVSLEDVVLAPFDAARGFPTFDRVLIKSGNRTVRIAFETPVAEGNESERVLNRLVELGCGYECANSSYVAVNVPSDTDLMAVRAYLDSTGVVWEHADPTNEELFGTYH